jgi:ferredoxin
VKGNLLSLLLGSISAGPIYAAFPIGKSLLSKGASITNIVIILSSWAVIKVPMLANEAKFLGVDFMIVRWILTVISIVIMGYLTAVIVKKKDLPGIKAKDKQKFTVKEEYCVGCGICSTMAPEIYEIQDKKAIVKVAPDNDKLIKAVIETVKKCPTNAIVYETE